MDALSSEWRRDVQYLPGDRVAFKIGDSMGAAAFECLTAHISTNANQVIAVSGSTIHEDSRELVISKEFEGQITGRGDHADNVDTH